MCKITAFKKASAYIIPSISTKSNSPIYRKLVPSFFNRTFTLDYYENLIHSDYLKVLEKVKTPLIKLNVDY